MIFFFESIVSGPKKARSFPKSWARTRARPEKPGPIYNSDRESLLILFSTTLLSASVTLTIIGVGLPAILAARGGDRQ